MWFVSDTELREELKLLKVQLFDLKQSRSKVEREIDLTEQVVKLKVQISELEIKKSELSEKHDREERELRHMIGLEKKRQEFEITQAKRETTSAVKEENLKADKARFEEQMKFNNDRFEKEVGYLKDILGQILLRLPNMDVKVEKKGR